MKQSVFDIQSPTIEKGSKSAEDAAMADAVQAVLAWVSDAQRRTLIRGYATMPIAVQKELLHSAVAGMGGVKSIKQCAMVLQKADEWLRARIAVHHNFCHVVSV